MGDKLLNCMDDSATLTAPHVFAGFELTCNSKQKYKVIALDAHGAHFKSSLQRPEAKVASKADLQRILETQSIVKGKYEQELVFSFIADNLHLVPEDEIFSGNNKIYARMRCTLRERVTMSAQRFGLKGPGPLAAE